MTRTRNWSGLCALIGTLALASCARSAPPRRAAPQSAVSAARVAELPAGATETAKGAEPLAAAATLENSVELADMATAMSANAFGFDDVPWLLDRAGAWLRARAGGAKTQPAHWQRRDRHGWQPDVMTWRPEGFTLSTEGDDTTVTLTESGCLVRVGKFSARCEPDVQAPAVMAAVVTGLAWPEGPGREAWSVEAFHVQAAHSIYLRLALAKLHVRIDLEIAPDGEVKSLAIRSLNIWLQPDSDGFAYNGEGIKWHWNVQPPGGKEAFDRPMLRLDNTAGVDLNVATWQAAAKARELTALGPFSAEIDLREDGSRIRAVQASVIAPVDERAQAGVQVIAVKPTPVEAVFQCQRSQLTRVMGKYVKPGCHVAQLLGLDPAAPPAMTEAQRHDAEVVVVLRGCP